MARTHAQLRSTRRGLALIAAFLVLALGLWALGREQQGTRGQDPAETGYRSPGTEPVNGPASIVAPNSQVSRRLDGSAPVAGKTPPPALQPLEDGLLRMEGRVVPTEGRAWLPTHAFVRVLREGPRGMPELLGKGTVGRDGRFLVDLPNTLLFGSESVSLDVRVAAQGYTEGWGGATVGDAVDGRLFVIVEVDSLDEDSGLCTGVTVAPGGAPIAGAEISYAISWPDGSEEEAWSTMSDTDGSFLFEAPPGTTVEVLATHASYGTATATGRVTAERPLELGHVALQPRGVISGRLMRLDRTGAEGVEITARLVEQPDQDPASVISGPNGQFRFANLTPGLRRIDHEYRHQRIEEPQAKPNVHGVDLELDRPTVEVRVVAPNGLPCDVGAFTAAPLHPETGREWRTRDRPWLVPRKRETGVWDVVLEGPMRLVVAAHVSEKGERYSAFEAVDIAEEHRAITLRLARDESIPVRISVVDPDGGPLHHWTGWIAGWAAGRPGTDCSSFDERVVLPKGDWDFRIIPGGSTFVLPFSTNVSVRPSADSRREPLNVELRAKRLGGRTRFAVAVAPALAQRLGESPTGFIELRKLGEERPARRAPWSPDGTQRTYPELLAAGTYSARIVAEARDSDEMSEVSEQVVVSPGLYTDIDVMLR